MSADHRWVIGSANTDFPWVLQFEPYPSEERARRAVNWQRIGQGAFDPVDYWRIVNLAELRLMLSSLQRGPYTEEAFNNFLATIYLSIDDAEHILADHWDNNPAIAEGWAIFNLGDDLGTGIEKDDEAAVFETDTAAEQFILGQDTDYHRRALEIQHAANSVRFHTWGPEWVDSRIGPQ